MSTPRATPDSILEVIVDELDATLPWTAVCAGFERGEWRHQDLSRDLISWVADWVLSDDELDDFSAVNGVDLLGKALSRVYQSNKFDNRGEVGELLLHIILRKFYKSSRLISRLYFKDASNDTVKGFDCVHVVATEDGSLELWLGESKLYTNSKRAATDVLKELEIHLGRDYLRYEFDAIRDKIPRGFPKRDELEAVLARRTSLDQAFQSIVIPLFISYDSNSAFQYKTTGGEYLGLIEPELRTNWQTLADKLDRATLPGKVRAHAFFMPMSTKSDLLKTFDTRLKAWQSVTKP